MKNRLKFYKNPFSSKKINGDIYKDAPDPFIIKVNGYYYLTSTVSKGIVIRRSFDLIHWDNVLKDGIVTIDDSLKYAFAPEIVYDNGYFYIVTSPCGGGHYLYRSENIEGPFVKISENFHEMIDGSFFIDNDGTHYFSRASETGIVVKKFEDDLKLNELGTYFKEQFTLENAILGGWTEGPYITKRYGYYYVTFTGTHFLSDAYRVSYVSGKKLEQKMPYGDFILLNTEEDFKGLGHSMNFVGPDLDSYYIVYHECNDKIKRRVSISRLFFEKEKMIVDNASREDNFMFSRPAFEDFGTNNNYLSEDEFDFTSFSLEYNFAGSESVLVFGYKSENNYSYIKLFESHIEFRKKYFSKDTLIKSISLGHKARLDCYHCLRVQVKNNAVAIYLDLVEYMFKAKLSTKGKIGYFNNSLKRPYIAISKFSFGDSDKETIKQKHVLISNMVSNNDYLITNFYVSEDDNYDIVKDNSNWKISKLEIDGKQVSIDFISLVLASNIYLEKGVHEIKMFFDELNAREFYIRKSAKNNEILSLDELKVNGTKKGKFEERPGYIHYENDRNALLSDTEFRNYEISATFELEGLPIHKENVGAIISSVNNYSAKNQFEGLFSFQGYMLACNMKEIYFYETNFHKSELLFKMLNDGQKRLTLKLIKENDMIFVYIDNVRVYKTKVKPYLEQGKAGIYSNHASFNVLDFKLIQGGK